MDWWSESGKEVELVIRVTEVVERLGMIMESRMMLQVLAEEICSVAWGLVGMYMGGGPKMIYGGRLTNPSNPCNYNIVGSFRIGGRK